MSALLAAAADAARIAGDVALRHYRTRLVVDRKDDGSPVTVADREAEQVVREWIERSFPDDGIAGEEFGPVREQAKRRWLIDPIDGTKTFIRGVPLWGSMIAVVEGDTVLAGAVYFPVLGELVVAGPGAGCWWNGIPCRASDVDDLARATVLTTDERFRSDATRRRTWQRLVARAGLSRSWGDCYGYLLVATGRAELMVDPVLSPWDSAALQPIIEEAGGVFTNWEGARTPFGGSAIATNRGIAAEARALLGPDPDGVAAGHLGAGREPADPDAAEQP